MAVLSIQSHVVYGHAGNSSAVFPLQRLGREVWAVNTVEFSNHTGYGAWRGRTLDAELVTELVQGIEERGVLSGCEAILSGYLGSPGVGQKIIATVKKVREAAPEALYCCDPVMGDVGRGFYVKPGIPLFFKNELIALADIVTPNQFELEALTDMDTSTPENARKAIAAIHARGPKVVLVTSYKEKDTAANHIDMLVSARTGSNTAHENQIFRIRTPELPLGAGMAGSGDLCTAVFLSRYLETKDSRTALELTTASVYGILEATWKAGSHELLTIAAQEELVSPSHSFTAEPLQEGPW
jgi:pyridoxine kinase